MNRYILRVAWLLLLLTVDLWVWEGYLAIAIVFYARFLLKHKTYITQESFKDYINVELIGMS